MRRLLSLAALIMRSIGFAPVALLALLVSCSGSEVATTTTTTTSTTTTSTSTTTSTTTTTTVPPTTVPPPPVSSTEPVDPGVAEVAARLDSLWPALNACRADPPACDFDGLLNEYFAPNASAVYWRETFKTMLVNNRHSTVLDRVQRFVASIDVDGIDAATKVCERDGSVTVASDGSVVDDAIGLGRYDWFWSKASGKWMVIGGATYGIPDTGDAVCDVYFH